MPTPGTVGTLRKSTATALYGEATGQWISRPEIAAAVTNPKTGINDQLHATNAANISQSIEQILPKIKAAAPHARRADIVNSLTLAYCPIVRHDTNIPNPKKITQINQFANQVYSELKSSGKE